MDDEDLTLPSSNDEDDATMASGGEGEPTALPQDGLSRSSHALCVDRSILEFFAWPLDALSLVLRLL